jgi:hypothetical protein
MFLSYRALVIARKLFFLVTAKNFIPLYTNDRRYNQKRKKNKQQADKQPIRRGLRYAD